MRGLLVLVALLGVAIADDDGCVCHIHPSGRSKRSSWAMNYGAARLDSQEVRIAKLSKQIDKLAHDIEDDTDHHYNRAVGELERRLEHIEGDDCHDHQFSCGRNSGQCVSDLLVCDHKNDCENGHDEEEAHICHNQAPAGRSWSGRANWFGCVARHHNQMSLLITGNRRMDHFPSVMWVDAVMIDKWTEDHHEVTKTWTTHGFYEYAHQRIVLESPDGSDKDIAMTCEDAGEGVADCKMMRESDGHVCGHAILTRAV